MVIKLQNLLLLTFTMTSTAASAQFYTISADTATVEVMGSLSEKEYSFVKDEKPSATVQKPVESSDDFDYFTPQKGREVSIEKGVPVFVNLTDSLLMGLIADRMTVCLPLDFLKVNSTFGTRIDPILKCRKFHDGIDLHCRHSYVYSMLPGVIKTVRYGNKGYGNHVVIEHGGIQCLYGHLSLISVKEGDMVSAGTIIGISGNTGKSTGEHLHIQLKKNGKSVDPEPFIAYLNRYITGLQDKIAYLKFGTKPDKDLNITNLYEAMERYDISHKTIVIAQALLETGYFTSRVCLECNNLFGLRRPSTGEYYEFDGWEKSVKAYRDYVQYKYKGGDYYQFLSRIGYAEDKDYIQKLRSIVRALSQ